MDENVGVIMKKGSNVRVFRPRHRESTLMGKAEEEGMECERTRTKKRSVHEAATSVGHVTKTSKPLGGSPCAQSPACLAVITQSTNH